MTAYAFNIIYDQYWARLYYTARKIVPDEDAKDIVAEVFIRLWRTDPEPVGDKLKAFLFICTKNACLSYLRHQDVRRIHARTVSEATYEASDIKADVIRQLSKLSVRERQVIIKSFVEGKNNEDVALEIRISNQSVRNLKREAVAKLKILFS